MRNSNLLLQTRHLNRLQQRSRKRRRLVPSARPVQLFAKLRSSMPDLLR